MSQRQRQTRGAVHLLLQELDSRRVLAHQLRAEHLVASCWSRNRSSSAARAGFGAGSKRTRASEIRIHSSWLKFRASQPTTRQLSTVSQSSTVQDHRAVSSACTDRDSDLTDDTAIVLPIAFSCIEPRLTRTLVWSADTPRRESPLTRCTMTSDHSEASQAATCARDLKPSLLRMRFECTSTVP